MKKSQEILRGVGIVVASLAVACGGGGGSGGGSGGDGAGGDAGASQTAGKGGSTAKGGSAGTASGGQGGSSGSGGGAAGTGGGAAGQGGGAAGAGGSAGGTAGAGGAVAMMGCVPAPKAIIRDFNDSHPDFGMVLMVACDQPALPADLVANDLDVDEKPVYNLLDHDPLLRNTTGQFMIDSKASFGQWWRPRGMQLNPTTNAQAASQTTVDLTVAMVVAGTYRIGLVASWWPIDGMLLGNKDGTKAAYAAIESATQNELWTAEMVFEIEYQGVANETLTLSSDDDSFLFVNKKLAGNNGLRHGPAAVSANLMTMAAALGLVVGQIYPVHVFMAERNLAGQLNLLARNIKFVNCANPKLPKVQ